MDSPRADDLQQLVFRGECLDGHEPLAVRRTVAEALKLDEHRAARLFSGRRVVLRREVTAAAAQRHIARFALMGALLHAEPSAPRTQRRAHRPRRRATPAAQRAPSRRPLRWVSVGLLGVAVALVLGVALWPMLSVLELGQRTTGTTASWLPPRGLPALPAQRGPGETPAAPAPSAPAGDADIPPDMTADALREYRLGYLQARGHKAFAISSGGAHAWHAGAPTANEASEGALADCMAARRPGDDGCRIVDLDGQWQE